MKKRSSKGIMGYVVLLCAILLIAILLNGGLGSTDSKRIEYPELLSRIRVDGAAVKRLLSGWRMPLMHLLHAIYFSKAGDGQ